MKIFFSFKMSILKKAVSIPGNGRICFEDSRTRHVYLSSALKKN
jgi:hypothetical protein